MCLNYAERYLIHINKPSASGEGARRENKGSLNQWVARGRALAVMPENAPGACNVEFALGNGEHRDYWQALLWRVQE